VVKKKLTFAADRLFLSVLAATIDAPSTVENKAKRLAKSLPPA
jgi:hypothetical protein